MDLRSSYPYSFMVKGIIRSYPSLMNNLTTEVAIIGAGITGALVAYYLNKNGIKVSIFDRRHTGMGSTAASTGLLQYEIDTPLFKLKEKITEENAVKSYMLCRQAIYDLKKLCTQLKTDTGFKIRPSFQFASFKKDKEQLFKEYHLRKKAGIQLQWLDETEIMSRFGFNKPAGILSPDGGEVDAYSLTHALLKPLGKKHLGVYDNTEIVAIHQHKRGVELIAENGKKIKAKKLVIACGYESQKYLPYKVENLKSTYCIASEPLSCKDFWYKNCLIWETASPYLYLRSTSDNRIIIGGKDDQFTNAGKRDAAITVKAKRLEKSFLKLFPHILFKTDFKWAGIFAETKDGLPYIGSIRQYPHTYFALGYGGNGIVFGFLSAQIIRDMIMGKSNSNSALFGFDR